MQEQMSESRMEAISNELKKLYKEDQIERLNIDFSQPQEALQRVTQEMMEHDKVRLARVHELINRKELKTGQDFLCAAMICQHSPRVEDYALAHLLALKASEMEYVPQEGEPQPLWLAAAAKDRWLVSIGQPQDFGTQYTRTPTTSPGQSERHPVNPNITDETRKQWHVPPLNEQKER